MTIPELVVQAVHSWTGMEEGFCFLSSHLPVATQQSEMKLWGMGEKQNKTKKNKKQKKKESPESQLELMEADLLLPDNLFEIAERGSGARMGLSERHLRSVASRCQLERVLENGR